MQLLSICVDFIKSLDRSANSTDTRQAVADVLFTTDVSLLLTKEMLDLVQVSMMMMILIMMLVILMILMMVRMMAMMMMMMLLCNINSFSHLYIIIFILTTIDSSRIYSIYVFHNSTTSAVKLRHLTIHCFGIISE